MSKQVNDNDDIIKAIRRIEAAFKKRATKATPAPIVGRGYGIGDSMGAELNSGTVYPYNQAKVKAVLLKFNAICNAIDELEYFKEN